MEPHRKITKEQTGRENTLVLAPKNVDPEAVSRESG